MMDDELPVRVDELYVSEIQELLREEGCDLSIEQAQMIANFVREVGGLDEALEVLGQLRSDRHAA